MSHFCGLVILTPEYAKTHDLEESLEKYYEGKETNEYMKGKVSDFDKINFLTYYNKTLKKNEKNFHKDFATELINSGVEVTPFEKYVLSYPLLPDEKKEDKYYMSLVYENKQRYVDFFKKRHPKILSTLPKVYKEHGEDWNGNSWRFDYITNEWCEYSTYNPDSKWDWYDEHGRWAGSILTKSGEKVDACTLKEIDWESESETDFKYSKTVPPYCLVIDGTWYERGEVGYWGMTSNEKPSDNWTKEVNSMISKLPPESEVYNIDFHI